MKRLLIVLTILFAIAANSHGQSYNMSNSTVTTCTGTFYDNGGTSTYSASQDLTYTICPGIAGAKIKLNFTTFNVEDNYDYLTIYDGPNTTSPTLGTYDNGLPLLGIVQATAGNASGCLTFVFHSDGSVQYDGWVATISCVQPCQLVQAVFSSSSPAASANYINICQGQTVTFNGSANYPQNGTSYTQSNATSTFTWNFGDGTTGTGQNVTHTYATGGGYDVNLTVTDINGCVSSNDIDLRVRVSTTPTFTGTLANPTTICMGQTSNLTGVYQMTPWTQPTGGVLGGTTFLPDGSGVSYTTGITFTDFAPGQTVTSANDIVDICLNMEHSFMGDLDITITCPNGSTTVLHDYSNGGGGTIIGNPVATGLPVDDNTSVLTPGTGLTYCFSPTATNGYIYTSTNWTTLATYTDPTGNVSTSVSQIPAGTYQAEGTWADLIGCPLNGTWTITVTDNLSADNGYIFWWGVDFNPALYPSLWGFTPTMASQQWSGPGLAATSTNPVTVTPASTGTQTYSYAITDNFGCTYNTTVNVAVNPGPTVNITPVSPTACSGSPVTLTASGATSYNWNTGGNTAAITVSPTTTTSYSVTGTTSGCAGSNTVTVNINPINTITLTSAAGTNAQTVCTGNPIINITYATTGATGATITGLPSGVNGNWASNVVTITGTPTVTGTYTYTITLTGGCGTVTATGTITVTVANTITLTSAAGTNAQSVCINTPITNITYATTGATGAVVTGLPAGVTGSWASNVFTITGTPTVAGNYPYTITTIGGCGTATTTGTITVITANTINLTSAAGTNAQTLCINSPLTNITYATTGATGATITGLPAGISGSWASNVVTITGSPSVSGSFNYTITTTGGCGVATATGTITVTPANTISLTSAAGTNAQTLCINTALTNITYATTGASGATVSGLPTGVTGSWASNVFTISGTPTVSGTYNYTITTTGGCGVATATGTIIVTPANTITLTSAAGTNAQSICINTPITNITYATTGATGATVTGLPAGVTGSWASNVFTISGTPTVAGTYTYTINTTGGCGMATATGTITIITSNTINLTSAAGTNAQTLCINTPLTNITYATTGATGATITGLPAGISGSWASNVVTITGSPSVSGTFNYTITTTGGCGVATSTGTITINPVNTITLTSAAGTNAQTLCINTNLTNITYATTGATGATFTGLLTGVTGNWSSNSITISGTPTVSGTFPYTIILTGGCGNISASGSITVYPIPVVSITPQNPAICLGYPVTLTASGATNYSWLPTAGLTPSTGGVVSASPASTSTYTVTGETSGCTNTATVTVTVNTTIPVYVTPSATSVCPGESVVLMASGAVNYSWTPTSSLVPASGPTVTATPVSTTTYIVEGTDANGCTGSASAVVSMNTLVNFGFVALPKTGCEPLNVDFLFTPGNAIMDGSWQWNFGDNNATSTDTLTNHLYTENGTYIVNLTAQTAEGCDISTQDTIRVYPMPVADFTAHPDVLTTEESSVNFIDNSTNASQWLWNFGDPGSDVFNTSNIQHPIHNYTDAGLYTVLLTASNEFGCVDTATKVITVNEAFAFWIPSAFSPNEDMVNDIFLPQGVGYLEDTYKLRILDRWGKILFYTEDITKGWDGKDYNTGIPQYIGVYTYMIEITDDSRHIHKYVGTVTLVN